MNHDQTSYNLIDNEEYMNSIQLEYFKNKLLQQKKDILEKEFKHLQEKEVFGLTKKREADTTDIAFLESSESMDYISSRRTRQIINDIESALEKIEDGTYGYCEESCEEIGIKRLDVQPTSRHCTQIQEAIDKKHKMQRHTQNDIFNN